VVVDENEDKAGDSSDENEMADQRDDGLNPQLGYVLMAFAG
jgi:hypothetical protein